MFERKWWSLTLKDGEPSIIPVPSGCPCIITGLTSVTPGATRVVIEGIIEIVRADLLGDEDDTVATQVEEVSIATLFPQKQATAQVMIPISPFNVASLRATGGDVEVSGMIQVQDAVDGLEELRQIEEGE